MTLALLLTAATGAWASGTVTVTEIKASEIPTSWENNSNPVKATDLPGFTAVTRDEAKALGAPAAEGDIYVFYAISHDQFIGLYWNNGVLNDLDGEFSLGSIYALKDLIKFYYTGSASSGIEVTWDASTKTGTFDMPGSDVVLTPIYANAAAFATTGTGSEATTLLPAAAEGVIAGTDASLIAEGTGIVANIGETTTAQGTLMYATGTATEAPELTAFSATAPTAENIADDGATVYVWYYIQGADAPQGEAATLDNTFNDTEPACLTVQVLTNKFDITFNAANANTIEAGKATVTVDGTDKTSAVTEGKLQGVKMGSEVKLEAKPGYKFRKVEVKKAEAAPAISFSKQSWGDANSAPANFISVSQADAKAAADAEKTQANAPGYVCIYALEGGQYKWIDSHGRTGQDSSIVEIAQGYAWDEVYECYSAGYDNSIWFTVEPTN